MHGGRILMSTSNAFFLVRIQNSSCVDMFILIKEETNYRSLKLVHKGQEEKEIHRYIYIANMDETHQKTML